MRVFIAAALLVGASWVHGQAPQNDAAPQDSNQGWRRLGQGNPGPAISVQAAGQPNASPPSIAQTTAGAYSTTRSVELPVQLTVPAGTFITIRVNQVLSSDRNQPGDAFSASLVKPIVVDGFIVADRGETIGGRVAEAKKAGKVSGVSRLGIELTELTLVDGTQVPLRTQLVGHEGSTSMGRDAAIVGTSSAVGAMIGGIEGGAAAGIGAAAGAGAALIGVLLTRGRPTLIYPESVLTFRVDSPIVVNTTRAPQAFREVGPGDYQQPSDHPVSFAQRPPPPPPPAYYPSMWGGWGPWWGPGWGWGYPGYYYGPRVSIGFLYGGYGRYGYGYGRGYGGFRGGGAGRGGGRR
jgi:hypothetical protein